MSLLTRSPVVERPETALPACTEPEVGQDLLAYEARRLDPAGVERFEEHLLLCHACMAELQRSPLVVAAVGASGEPAEAKRPHRWMTRPLLLAASVLVALGGVSGWLALRSSRAEERRQLLARASDLEAEGSYSEAEALFQDAATDRASRHVLHRLGTCAFRLGRLPEAEQKLREALERPDREESEASTDNAVAQVLGEVLLAEGKDRDVEELVAARLVGPGTEDAWGRAMLYSSLARRAYFDRGDRGEGDRLLGLAERANAEVARLQPDSAKPNHESPYYRMARFRKLVDLDGDYASAVAEAERILALKRTYDAAGGGVDQTADGLNFLGTARLLAARIADTGAEREKLLGGAEEALTESRRLRESVAHPGSRIGVVWAAENLGLVALERGEAGRAVALLEGARDLLGRIEGSPAEDRGELLVNLGTAYAAVGKSDDARKSYQAAKAVGAGRRVEVASALGMYVLDGSGNGPEARALAANLRSALGERLGAHLLAQVRDGLAGGQVAAALLPRLEVLRSGG